MKNVKIKLNSTICTHWWLPHLLGSTWMGVWSYGEDDWAWTLTPPEICIPKFSQQRANCFWPTRNLPERASSGMSEHVCPGDFSRMSKFGPRGPQGLLVWIPHSLEESSLLRKITSPCSSEGWIVQLVNIQRKCVVVGSQPPTPFFLEHVWVNCCPSQRAVLPSIPASPMARQRTEMMKVLETWHLYWPL